MYPNWYSCLHFPDTTTLSLIAVTYSRVFQPCYVVPRIPLPRFQSPPFSMSSNSDACFQMCPVHLCLRCWIVFKILLLSCIFFKYFVSDFVYPADLFRFHPKPHFKSCSPFSISLISICRKGLGLKPPWGIKPKL